MTALDWLRSKATAKPSISEPLEYEGALYAATYHTFKGRLPYRMRKELSGAALIKGEFEHENIRIICTPSGHQTGEVEYFRATYTKIN